METTKDDVELAEFVSQFYDDPLGFVIAAYPWDSDPELQIVELKEPWKSRFPGCRFGPDAWACRLLDDIAADVKRNAFDGRSAVPAVRVAVSSGHGIGKSAISAWLVDWIMSTRPFAKGTITATTNGQLESRTWAQIATWTKKCITAHWFNLKTGRGSMRIECIENASSWFATAQSCRKENSEAFAGQHAASSTSFYLFDEGSGVENVIYEVAEGGLTDGEPMFFVFGNPTRNSGAFYDIFHKDRDRWHTYKVDSREAQITNKATIEEWKQRYGEDSDFFKVRVRGEFPSASIRQLIPTGDVEGAMARELPVFENDRALALIGVDIARYGDDSTVLRVRSGRNARFAAERYKGLSGVQVAEKIINMINYCRTQLGFRRVIVFGDGGGLGGPVLDIVRSRGYTAYDVNFGAGAEEKDMYADKRSEMWCRMRDWMKVGCLDDDADLKDDLTAPEYTIDEKGRFRLESKDDMKKRGLHSPDNGDALALTFAHTVNEELSRDFMAQTDFCEMEFDPFA